MDSVHVVNVVNVVVRTIVGQFFPFRGLTPDAPMPSRDAVEGATASDAVVRVSASGAPAQHVLALVLAPGGKYMTNSTQLRELLERAPPGPVTELIVVADDTFFAKKNMTDVIVTLRAAGTAVSAARFCNFVCDIPAHLSAVPHEIVSPADVAAILGRERRKLSDLPRIYLSDPMVVWIGARAGQVVKITRDSQTAGVAICYRLVVAGAL